MKERPILFSAPMVRALLAGTKTQTRRVVKPQPTLATSHWDADAGSTGKWIGTGPSEATGGTRQTWGWAACPYGLPGDGLRVKEAAWMWCERRPNGTTPTGRDKWWYVPMRAAPVIYAADHPQKPLTGVVSPDTGNAWGWRLKIGRFLPAWASRTTLEIVSIRVERLQDISEADAETEGVDFMLHIPDADEALTAIELYEILWEAINGAGSWALNPWVWVVEFRRING